MDPKPDASAVAKAIGEESRERWLSATDEEKSDMIKNVTVTLIEQAAMIDDLRVAATNHKDAILNAQKALVEFDRAFRVVWERVTGEELNVDVKPPKVH